MTHIFLSYAKNDETKVEPLRSHLRILERNSEISVFSLKDLQAGDDTDVIIEQNLQKANIFLACVSADYHSDEDCQRLLERANRNKPTLRIIPVLLRPCNWENGILSGIAPLPKSRKFLYEQTGNYIDENCTDVVTELKALIADISTTTPSIHTNLYTLNSSLLDPTDANMLYGRRADYEKLCTAMEKDKVVNIKGIAGIGKTTLVQFYLSQAVVQKRFPIVHKIVLADSRKVEELFSSVQEKDDYVMKNLKEALVLYFADKISYENADEKTKFQMILNYIRPNAHQTLFVFDNADELMYANKILAFLNKINCQIIISSRNHIQNCTEISIEKVALFAAKKMFAAYNNMPYPPEKVEQLLHNIDCHTLLIELCAKQLKENATINIDTLIQDTAAHNLSNLSAKDIVLSDNTVIETELYKFVLYIFKPNLLSDAEQQILRYFSLLRNVEYPLEKLKEWFKDTNNNNESVNINLNFFQKIWNKIKLYPKKKEKIVIIESIPETLNLLFQKGWLYRINSFDVNNQIEIYQCHLIISYVSEKLLVPTIDNCKTFLKNIEKEGWHNNPKHIIYQTIYLPELLRIEKYWEIENIIITNIQISIANLYSALGNYTEALIYNEKAANINKKIIEKESITSATIYNNRGLNYKDIGDYDAALTNYDKALTICKKELGNDHPNTATTYDNIGETYRLKGNLQEALEHCLKSLSIREKVLKKEHPEIAQSYNNIGLIYDNKSDYLQALEYYQKALTIFEKLPEKYYSDVAVVYDNIGVICFKKRNYSDALISHQKSLSINEKILGKEHFTTAINYNNMAMVYEASADYETAWKYINLAIKIIEKKLPPNHPYIIGSKKIRERIQKKR